MYKDGVSTIHTQDTVLSTETMAGELWRVEVTASDDWGTSDIGSAGWSSKIRLRLLICS